MSVDFERLIRDEGMRGLNKLITDFNQVKTLEAPPHSVLVSPDGTVDPAVQVDNSGNVGVGTTSPQTRLHVVIGEGSLPSLTGDGALVQNNDDAADDAQMWLIGGASGQSRVVFGDVNRENNARVVVDHSDDSLRFYTNGAFRQIITGATGRFGVQAFVPQAKVDILSNTDKQLRLSFQGGVKFVNFDVDTNHDLTIQPSSTGQIILLPTTDSTDFFQVKDAAASVILNVDATNERVGVGTASPSTALTVNGASGVSVRIENSGDADRGGELVVTGAAGSGGIELNTTSSGYIITFAIDSTEVGRWDTGGNFLVNLTTAVGQANVSQDDNTAAKPVLHLVQADVDEAFLSLVGVAASADLTRSLVDDGDVTTATLVGWYQIDIDDTGNQITDGAYYVPFYSLA